MFKKRDLFIFLSIFVSMTLSADPLKPIKDEETISPSGYFASDFNANTDAKESSEGLVSSDRPYYEIRIDTDRSGYESYYRVGEGFLVTDFFGVASSFEFYDEQKNISDMVGTANLEAPNFGGSIPLDQLQRFTRPVYTRDYISYATIKHKTYPLRLRYTYTYKDYILQYINKDILHWDQHNFDLLFSLEMFGRSNFLNLNPIFERRYINKQNRDLTKSFEDWVWLQYTICPVNHFEFFGFFSWAWSEGITFA
ncbi:MAG: hypothetical protein Q8Q33_03205, partial [Chlamydiota bacterium]|nr:hypothetical protein [Chlamydiota bacterium]